MTNDYDQMRTSDHQFRHKFIVRDIIMSFIGQRAVADGSRGRLQMAAEGGCR